MKKTLGQTLKECRELNNLTLRQVEESVGASNAYLSQLENDKIKKPSANVLYKLASFYKIELEELLFAAGIIKEVGDLKRTIALKKIGVQVISTQEENELIEYLGYLRWKKRK